MIIERFNQTLKNKMWKILSLRGSFKCHDILHYLISEYNSKHSIIKMKPKDVDKNVNIAAFAYNKNAFPRKQPKFKVGDSSHKKLALHY